MIHATPGLRNRPTTSVLDCGAFRLFGLCFGLRNGDDRCTAADQTIHNGFADVAGARFSVFLLDATGGQL
jgi:hypothetical protein